MHYETVSGVRYSVQCVEYNASGGMIEDVMRSYELFSEALDAFNECYTWLKLSARVEKAREIYTRIQRKITAYEDNHTDYAPKAWIRALKKVRKWLWDKEPQVEKRDFWDCYL